MSATNRPNTRAANLPAPRTAEQIAQRYADAVLDIIVKAHADHAQKLLAKCDTTKDPA